MKIIVRSGIIISLAILAGYAFLWHFVSSGSNITRRLDNLSSNPNPIIRHFSPTWRSIKKILDVPYLLRSTSHVSSLPHYAVTISNTDFIELIANLPDYPREYKLLEDDKYSTRGSFAYESYYSDQAEIRFRGVSPNHWNAIKKSVQINLPPAQPLQGRTTYRFFLSEDKGWVNAMLWNHISQKLRIMTPAVTPARLAINGKEVGVYLLIEGWEPSLLDRYEKLAGNIFSNKNIETNITDLWRSDQISQWYNRSDPAVPATSYPELAQLLHVVSETPDEEFAREIPQILDMDTFYRWTVATVLSGNFHQGNIANMNFYFNPETKKFEPILFDATISPLGEVIDVRNHRVVNRILQHKEFRQTFDSLLTQYIRDTQNLQDDLTFYDTKKNELRLDIFSDTSKIQTSLEAMQQIQRDRANYIHTYMTLQKMLREENGFRYTFAEETYPLHDLAN